jgi:(2Fe-2S) ferredoxin
MIPSRKHVFTCRNRRPGGESCRGGTGDAQMFRYAKARARELGLEANGGRVNKAGRPGRGEQEPTLAIYLEGIWHTFVGQVGVEEIIQRHPCRAKRVERLMP